MKQLAVLVALCGTLGACTSNALTTDITPDQNTVVVAGSLKTVTYTATTKDIRNPERGFYADSEYSAGTPNALTVAGLQSLISGKYSAGYQVSLIHRSYFLPEFINAPSLPVPFLNVVQQDLQAARGAGVKLILRFAYRTIALEDCNALPPAAQPACVAKAAAEHDPTKATILGHLENLRPILTANVAAIAYVDAGLLGTYGEWAYATDQGLGSLLSGFPGTLAPDPLYGYADGTTANANTQEIIAKFLDVLPGSRAIAIRTPAQRISLLQGYPSSSVPAPGLTDAYDPRSWNPALTTITDATAFQDTNLARLGAHNDCFLASADDFGTYYYGNYPGINTAAQITKEKNYLSANNLFVPMGGETCAVNADVPSAQFPAYAKAELRTLRWSTLNTDYNNVVLTAMGATLTDAKKNLGYRFALQSSTLPMGAARGEAITVKFTVKNEGYASPYNPRNLEIVFVKAGSAPIRRSVTLSSVNNTDPRFWKPLETKVVTLRVNAPGAAGTYGVSLNLPDPLIPNDARYSLRLANSGLWDAAQVNQTDSAAAFNALNQTIQIP